MDETLTLLFAERIVAIWRDQLDPMTYKRYVRKFIAPGSELDQGVKKQRLRQYQELWQELKALDSALYDHYRAEWIKAKDLLTSHHVFLSFFRLLQFLKDKEINHSIVLRTFGKDLDFVLREIERVFPELSFQRGQFSQKELRVGDHVMTNFTEIQQYFLKHHVAIQDDHHHWHHHHQEQASGGKPFPYEVNECIVTLFFDDNLKRKQIVQVIDLNIPARSFSSIDLIQQGVLHGVDTLDAIENENYFIDHVRLFLEPL